MTTPWSARGLAAIIERESDMTVVAEAADGRTAVEQFLRHRPDITLMDLSMPGGPSEGRVMDGVAAIAAIREQVLTARIVILTTYDDDEDIYRGLRAGAKAYLLKDAPPDELLEAIRAVHAGMKRIGPRIAAKLADRMSSPELTGRETEVLRHVANGESNQEIAAALSIAEGTVKFHVNNLLAKLGASDRTQAVTIAIKRGIVRLG
jgi:DNA-binding NarL/FixJ family response regulator